MDIGPNWSPRRIKQWLQYDVKLPQYGTVFQRHNVTFQTLLSLTEEDLEREYGIIDKSHQETIMGKIMELWGKIDDGSLNECNYPEQDADDSIIDDDEYADTQSTVELEVHDDNAADQEQEREHADLLERFREFQRQDAHFMQITMRLQDIMNVPQIPLRPLRIQGNLGPVEEELYVPPTATSNDMELALAINEIDALDNCEPCTICIEDNSRSEMALLSVCGHSFCYECLGNYVQTKLSEERPIVCPQCATELQQEDVERILSPPVFHGPKVY